MSRISIFFISVLLVLIFTSRTSYAFNPFDILKIIKGVTSTTNIIEIPSTVSPFGGKITSSKTACSVKFWIWQIVCTPFGCFPVPCPNCGSIPIAGTVIKVSTPGIPVSEVFTFPGITKVYPNNHQNKVGVWTLGTTLKTNIAQKIVDKINSALKKIPKIPIPPNGWLDQFHLVCPKGGIILKIGTS